MTYLFSLRATIALLVAALAALIAFLLAYFSSRNLATAGLASGGAACAALLVVNAVVGTSVD